MKKHHNISEEFLSDNFNPTTIVVFDSGVGGLSVYNEIRKKLPKIRYLYVFDNLFFPYGEKNKEFITNRLVKILTAVQKNHTVSLAVIACNTASVMSIPTLRKKFHFPIIGSVPAIKYASRLTKNKIVGLLATRGTLECHYTRSLINLFSDKCQIKLLSSTELVKIAESKIHGEELQLKSLNYTLQPWLNSPPFPDTVVLGCTHFSLLKNELISIFPPKTNLVDSINNIACLTEWILHRKFDKNKNFINMNVAYCTAFTKKIEKLFPVLYYLNNFKVLKQLSL